MLGQTGLESALTLSGPLCSWQDARGGCMNERGCSSQDQRDTEGALAEEEGRELTANPT
jgi:hypothetical protein